MIPAQGTVVFDNTDFGGSHRYIPSVNDNPDYPWEPTEINRRRVYTAAGGEMWVWTKYQKRKFRLHFEAVGTDPVATLGSIALENKDLLFLIVHSDTGTDYKGTVHWIGEEFRPTEMVKGLWNFEYDLEEVSPR